MSTPNSGLNSSLRLKPQRPSGPASSIAGVAVPGTSGAASNRPTLHAAATNTRRPVAQAEYARQRRSNRYRATDSKANASSTGQKPCSLDQPLVTADGPFCMTYASPYGKIQGYTRDPDEVSL